MPPPPHVHFLFGDGAKDSVGARQGNSEIASDSADPSSGKFQRGNERKAQSEQDKVILRSPLNPQIPLLENSNGGRSEIFSWSETRSVFSIANLAFQI